MAPFRAWALPMHRKSDVLEDSMITATALVHGLTVAMRNVADFRARVGLDVCPTFLVANRALMLMQRALAAMESGVC